MARRLNGWQRIGITLSVIGIVAAPIYWTAKENEEAVADAASTYRLCRAGEYPVDAKTCSDFSDKVLARHSQFDPHLSGHVVMALILLALAWLVAWVVIRVARWVVRGFRPVHPPE